MSKNELLNTFCESTNILPPETEDTHALRRDSKWLFSHFGVQATSDWSVRSENLHFRFGVGRFLDSKGTQLRVTSKQENTLNMNSILHNIYLLEQCIIYCYVNNIVYIIV